jgi:hypothetical protein
MAQKNTRHASTVLLAATLQLRNSFAFVLSDGFDLEFGLELDRPSSAMLKHPTETVGANSFKKIGSETTQSMQSSQKLVWKTSEIR